MSDNEMVVLDELKQPMGLADVFVKSGIFPDVRSQAQGVVKILCGKELGLTPFQSMGGLYFVNGKIGIQANIAAGLIRKSKKYDYTVVKRTAEVCEIDFFDITDKDTPKKLGTVSFGKAEAARAGLINKDNYKNYPESMYFARAMSAGSKTFTPDVLMGYSTIEELQDTEPKSEPSKTTVTVAIPDAEVLTNGKA
jgi:hypothetical protein